MRSAVLVATGIAVLVYVVLVLAAPVNTDEPAFGPTTTPPVEVTFP